MQTTQIIDARRVRLGVCRHCGGPVPCWSRMGDAAVGRQHTVATWRHQRDLATRPLPCPACAHPLAYRDAIPAPVASICPACRSEIVWTMPLGHSERATWRLLRCPRS